MPDGRRDPRGRWRRRSNRPARRDVLVTIGVTAIVTAALTIFLLLSVNRFDADELQEIAAVATALGPTLFAALRYLKES